MSGSLSQPIWMSAPLAGGDSAATATGGSSWRDAPTEITDQLGGIVDDPARAAPLKVIANASMFPNTQDRIPIYAKALGIPESEFATMGDKIVYRDPQNPNQYVRVEPSVSGATGPVDALKRVAGYVAGSAGPAIPAVASIAAGIGTRGNVRSILAAGASGGAGDVARQGIGNLINGRPVGDIDYMNVTGQAALGAGGQALGVGGQAFFNRVPFGLPSAENAWLRNPANLRAAQENADLLTSKGITATAGTATGRESLLNAERQLRRGAGTADDMATTYKRINTQEVPAAARSAADNIAPDIGTDNAARNFRAATKEVIDAPRVSGNRATANLYRDARAAGNQWTPELETLLQNKEMQSLYRAAATRAERDVTMGTPGAVSFPPLSKVFPAAAKEGEIAAEMVAPPFQAWQTMRIELSAQAKKAKLSGDADTARQLSGMSAMMDDALKSVNPSYAEAQILNRPGQEASALLRDGVLRGVSKTSQDAPAARTLGGMFNPARASVASIGESRAAYIAAGKAAEWDSAFSAYVRTVADKASGTLANGETGNVAGKIFKELFSDDTKRSAVAAALGGRSTPAYKAFAETMRAFELTSSIKAIGSQTATDVGQLGATASPTARAAASGLRNVSPSNWLNMPARIGDWIENASAGRAAGQAASQYLSGPAFNRAALDTVRIMHPGVAGLLSVGARGGAGAGAGLLGIGTPPADWQPYQPLPSR